MANLNIKMNLLKNNRCYQSAKKRTAIGIQLHTIGCAQGTAQSVADYWNQSGVSACVHYIVDCDTPYKVLQCLPEEYRAWADGGYGNGNLITFEICESDYMKYTSGANFTVTNEEKFKADIKRGYETAVLLCADICKRYRWNPKAKLPSGLYLISSHDEGRRAGLSTSHVDPTHVWSRLGFTMDKFRDDVAKALDGAYTTSEIEVFTYYRVRKSWTDVDSQIGAYLVFDNAKANCLPGYSVYDEKGKCLFSKEKRGLLASDLNGLTESEKITRIAPLYQDVMRKTGMLASVGIAQFCLESGYGTTDLAQHANNLHGMKCSLSGNTWNGTTWDGKSQYVKYSPEVYNGVQQMVQSAFRKYECCEDSIADRAAYFIGAKNGSNLRYPNINKIKDYKEQIKAIKAGGYATDPNYVDKLVSIVNRFNLFKYDEVDVIETPKDNIEAPNVKWIRVGIAWREGRCIDQIGAFESLENAKKYADKYSKNLKKTHYAFDENGIVVYTAEYEPRKQYVVQVGRFQIEENARRRVEDLKKAGFDAVIQNDNRGMWIQAGVFTQKKNADALMKKLKKSGFDTIFYGDE